jgi:hypothetical protein
MGQEWNPKKVVRSHCTNLAPSLLPKKDSCLEQAFVGWALMYLHTSLFLSFLSTSLFPYKML